MNRVIKQIIKNKKILTISENDTVLTATEIMLKNKIDGVLIVNGSNDLLGIFTDSDLKKLVLEGLDPKKTKASSVGKMGKLWSVSPDKTLCYAIHIMHDYQIRHLPVIDENDKVIGLISSRDLISADFNSYEPEQNFKECLEQLL